MAAFLLVLVAAAVISVPVTISVVLPSVAVVVPSALTAPISVVLGVSLGGVAR